jgi:hypothetical protein
MYSKSTQYYWKNKKKKGKTIHTAARSIRARHIKVGQSKDEDVENNEDNSIYDGPVHITGFDLLFSGIPLVQEMESTSDEEEETPQVKTVIQGTICAERECNHIRV